MQKQNAMDNCKFPPEVFDKILSFFTFREMQPWRGVCREMKELVEEHVKNNLLFHVGYIQHLYSANSDSAIFLRYLPVCAYYSLNDAIRYVNASRRNGRLFEIYALRHNTMWNSKYVVPIRRELRTWPQTGTKFTKFWMINDSEDGVYTTYSEPTRQKLMNYRCFHVGPGEFYSEASSKL